MTSSSGGGSYSTEPVDKMSGGSGGGMNNGMSGGMNSMDGMRNSPSMDGSGQVGRLGLLKRLTFILFKFNSNYPFKYSAYFS